MHNRYFNRSILSLIVFMILLMPLSAKTEVWTGTSLIANTSNLDSSERIHFSTVSSDTDSIADIIYMGPSLDVTVIPYSNIPIGIDISSELLFPIGYNKDHKFRSFHGDFKNRNMIGISYNQIFNGGWGLSIAMGYEYDFSRVSIENKKNDRAKQEYNTFDNQALYGELTLLTAIDKGYFKFGINYSHSIINTASSHDMVFAGGYRF